MSEDNYKPKEGLLHKSFFLMLTFFIITPIVLGTSSFALLTLAQQSNKTEDIYQYTKKYQTQNSGVSIYASLPETVPEISATVTASDARCEIIRQYLVENKSPLEANACDLVTKADQYGIDWRLLTAIAQKESGLCKAIPPGSHNCWGWGIHSEGSLGFGSYLEAIDTVSRGLKEKYIDLGYVTTEEIMSKYAHPDSTTWADGVNYYLDQLQ